MGELRVTGIRGTRRGDQERKSGEGAGGGGSERE